MDLIIAVIVGFIGFGLFGWLIFILFRAITPLFGKHVGSLNPFLLAEQKKLSNCFKLVEVVDQQIEAGNYDAALNSIEKSFFFGNLKFPKNLLENARSHNLSLLGKLLTVSQKKGTRLSDLPELEDLFEERFRLLDLYFNSSTLREKIKEKYKREGREGGSWGGAEFQKQMDDLAVDIEKNRKELVKEIKAILNLIKRDTKDAGVTYH